MRHVLRLALFGFGFAAACHSQPKDAASALRAQWSGPQGGGEVATTRVIRTAAEWDALWRQLERERPRALDPLRECAVLIAAGAKRTAGFGVEVRSAQVRDGTLIVEYRERAPEPGTMVAQMLTSPWAVAVLARPELPIVFQRSPPAAARHEK